MDLLYCYSYFVMGKDRGIVDSVLVTRIPTTEGKRVKNVRWVAP